MVLQPPYEKKVFIRRNILQKKYSSKEILVFYFILENVAKVKMVTLKQQIYQKLTK